MSNRPTLTLEPSIYKGWSLDVRINSHNDTERPIGGLTYSARKTGLYLKACSLDDLTDQIDRSERTAVRLTPPLTALCLLNGQSQWEVVTILELVGENFVYRRKDGREASERLAALLPRDGTSDYSFSGRYITDSAHNREIFEKSNALKRQIAELSDQTRSLQNQLTGLRESDLIENTPKAVPPAPATAPNPAMTPKLPRRTAKPRKSA